MTNCVHYDSSATSVGNTEHDRPYYIRRYPATLVSQPLDGNLGCEDFVSLTCEAMGMEPIISGWWPNIYWRHNGSTVNSTWPGNITIDTNYWNMTTLHTSFPGTYRCIVDDGSFILASRLATVKEGENIPLEHSCSQEIHLSDIYIDTNILVCIYYMYNSTAILKGYITHCHSNTVTLP